MDTHLLQKKRAFWANTINTMVAARQKKLYLQCVYVCLYEAISHAPYVL